MGAPVIRLSVHLESETANRAYQRYPERGRRVMQVGLIIRPGMHGLDKYLAVNRLAEFPVGGGRRYCCEPRGSAAICRSAYYLVDFAELVDTRLAEQQSAQESRVE